MQYCSVTQLPSWPATPLTLPESHSLPRCHMICALVGSRSGLVVGLWGTSAVTSGLAVEKASPFCPGPGVLAHSYHWA